MSALSSGEAKVFVLTDATGTSIAPCQGCVFVVPKDNIFGGFVRIPNKDLKERGALNADALDDSAWNIKWFKEVEQPPVIGFPNGSVIITYLREPTDSKKPSLLPLVGLPFHVWVTPDNDVCYLDADLVAQVCPDAKPDPLLGMFVFSKINFTVISRFDEDVSLEDYYEDTPPTASKQFRYYEVEKIIEAYKSGDSLLKVAEKYYCSRETVRQILLTSGVPVRSKGGKKVGNNLHIVQNDSGLWLADSSGKFLFALSPVAYMECKD